VKYLCWGDDHEDLTAAVTAERGRSFPVVELNVRAAGAATHRGRVVVSVKCSHGHENVIVNEDAPCPPTGSEQMWIAARDELTPAHSVTVADQKAQWLLGLVGVFTALLTAFGIVADPKLLTEHWALVAIPVSLVALSFSVVVFGATPSYALLDGGDLRAVEEFFTKRLRRAGITVRIGGVLFALALLSIVPLYGYLASRQVGVTIRPGFRWAATPNGATVTVTVEITGLRRGSSRNVKVRGASNIGASGEALLKQSFNSASEGPVSISVDLPNAQRFKVFAVEVRLVGPDGHPAESQKIEFTP
jgi:hypothetical protein